LVGNAQSRRSEVAPLYDGGIEAAETSLLGDVCVVKKLQDFVTWTRYNFRNSTFRRRVQAPVFTECLGADMLLPKFGPTVLNSKLMLGWHSEIGECK
jgi:hypothetical protein